MKSTDVDGNVFSYWLRTGRLPAARSAAGLELNFNPWHDPDNERFTFADTGDYHPQGGGGGGGSGAKAARRRRRLAPKSPASSDDPVITAQQQRVDDVEALSDQGFDAFEGAARAGRWTERRENAEIHICVRLKEALEARRRSAPQRTLGLQRKKAEYHSRGSLEQGLRQSAALRENNAIVHWQAPSQSVQWKAKSCSTRRILTTFF